METTGLEKIRINKYLAKAGICSRRQADAMIAEGRVLVNGLIPNAGDTVCDEDIIEVDGTRLSAADKPKRVVLAYNKPVGIVCSMVNQGKEKNSIADAIDYKDRVFPIGRLDKDSEGLILLTNDGAYADEVMRANNGHEKEYIVRVNKTLEDAFFQAMSTGVTITFKDETQYRTKPCKVRKISNVEFAIILTEGKNRQIRRMCSALGYDVVSLKRIRIMDILLGDLKTGEYRIIP